MPEGYAFKKIHGGDKYSAIDEVIRSCGVFDDVEDRVAFIKAVHDRERIQSTGVGHGVAIAHGKVASIPSCRIALGWSREGIAFDDKYSEPVHLVFVIASSPSRQDEYIHAVSHILSWVHDDRFCRALKNGNFDDDEVRRFLGNMDAQRFEMKD